MPVKSPILHSKNAKSNEKFMKLRNPDLLWVASATSVATGIVWCFIFSGSRYRPTPGLIWESTAGRRPHHLLKYL